MLDSWSSLDIILKRECMTGVRGLADELMRTGVEFGYSFNQCTL
jgi:hypothetical protein